MLFTELKLSPNTVIVRLAALRFFYIHVLKRNWSIAETPYPKKVLHVPQVLSQEEVARFFLQSPSNLRSRGILFSWRHSDSADSADQSLHRD
jgi:site-specific recombinase XerD